MLAIVGSRQMQVVGERSCKLGPGRIPRDGGGKWKRRMNLISHCLAVYSNKVFMGGYPSVGRIWVLRV